MIMKYRRLVTDVEAERIEEGWELWPGGTVRKQQLPTFNRYRKDGMPSKNAKVVSVRTVYVVSTPYGDQFAKEGDWVVRHPDGTCYPMTHEMFINTFAEIVYMAPTKTAEEDIVRKRRTVKEGVDAICVHVGTDDLREAAKRWPE